jgi:hypothetical protein
MRRASLLLAGPALVLALGLGACGSDDDPPEEETGTTTTTEADGSSTTEGDGTSTTDDEGSSTTDRTATTIDPADLPGEVVEIYPYEGAELSVVGVEAEDTLNVRAGPGTDFDVVTELDPLADGLVSTGQVRTLDDGSYWVEVQVDGVVGWTNRRFVSEMTGTTDVTHQLPQGLGGETMLDLAEAVADARAGVEEGPAPTMTVVDGPSVGDLGEITIDLVGYQDDAVSGERLHIFATPDESGEGFVLKTVEATTMCTRGVTEGVCL